MAVELEPLLWQVRYWQDEDKGRDDTQGPGVRKQNAAGSFRGVLRQRVWRAGSSEGLQEYMDELDGVDVKELAIHRRVSRLKYSRRCAEASAVQEHLKQGLPLAPGMEIGYVVQDARK